MDIAYTLVICKAVAVLTNRSTPLVRWYGFFILITKKFIKYRLLSPLKSEIYTNIPNLYFRESHPKKMLQKNF